jgi:hypothetical protein
MSDPNSCETCEYKRIGAEGGWCYMFREQPAPLCMQHQDRRQKQVIIGHVGYAGRAALIGAVAAAAGKNPLDLFGARPGAPADPSSSTPSEVMPEK